MLLKKQIFLILESSVFKDCRMERKKRSANSLTGSLKVFCKYIYTYIHAHTYMYIYAYAHRP